MFHPELQRTLSFFICDPIALPADREVRIGSIAEWIREHFRHHRSLDLVFICTHNSRRSQFAQVWASFAASYHGLPIRCRSAGTEVTEVALPVVDALEHAGFRIGIMEDHFNVDPRQVRYTVNWADDDRPVQLYSKMLDLSGEPKRHCAAISVCSSAEQNCPIIPGIDRRFSLPYSDPKESDGMANEAITYRERSMEIAREMFKLMELVSQ